MRAAMKRAFKGAIAAVAVSLVAGGAWAIDEPEAIIKYRQAVMGTHGNHASAIYQVVIGEVSFSDHVAAHAAAINATAKMIPSLFPRGTGEGDTDAKMEIWGDWEKFTAAARKLEQESAKLVEVAEGGDMAAIGAQFEELGKACGGCHKPFRKEKK